MRFPARNSHVGARIFGHSTIVIFFPCALVSFHFARIGLVLVPCRYACAAIVDTIRGHEKASLRVPREAVRIAVQETQREASAYALSLQCVVLLKFSNVSLGDCFAALQIAVISTGR